MDISPFHRMAPNGRSVQPFSGSEVLSALRRVTEGFPFPERVTLAQRARAVKVAVELSRWIAPPARVADLGTGMALVPALLAELGYDALGVDDFGDPWHTDEATSEIIRFAERTGFKLVQTPIEQFAETLDAAILVGVVEHMHDSPRILLNHVGQILRPGGAILVLMPNSVNLRKRFDVVRGRTNYPQLEDFFYCPPPWRGHVREYTPRETGRLLQLMGFDLLLMGTFDSIAFERLAGLRLRVFRAVTDVAPNMKDYVIAVGRRPEGWMPVAAQTEGRSAEE